MSAVVVKVNIDEKKLNKIIKGKNVTIKNEGEGGMIVLLHFKERKDALRLKRNFNNGKGFIVVADQIEKVEDAVNGGKILGTVLKHLKNIGMKAGEAFKVNNKVSLNPFELGYDLGHDVIAPALMKNGINFVPKSQRG